MFLTILSSLFTFFGCLRQSKEANTNLSKDSLEEIVSKSIENLKNRDKHQTLTEQILDTTSEDEISYIIFESLNAKLPKDYTKEYQTVLTWTKPRQAIYMICLLEMEVNNGGYNQFYYNTSGQYYKHLPDALDMIGAKKFADLTERANKVYEQENNKITKNQDGTIEGFSKSYDDNPLNKFDNEFYDLYKVEDLQKLQVDYIRAHKQEFIDN